MDVALFSAKPYDRETFAPVIAATGGAVALSAFDARLTADTAPLARGYGSVCAFVHDVLSEQVLGLLSEGGTRLIALRCAGFNTVDLDAARALNLRVVRVPAYSPHSVAEHTVGLMLALNRRLHRAYNRVRDGNFELTGLMGFEMRGRTVGVIGTGKIGAATAQALSGFGVRLIGFDVAENPVAMKVGLTYAPLEAVIAEADILTLHCPLTPQTHHMIDAARIASMKPGAMLINTGRGALIDASAVVEGLKSGRIGALGLDVYEQEEKLFFHDRSSEVLQDDVFSRLLTFPNVIITGHQAFFTRDALDQIAAVTVDSIRRFASGEAIPPERAVV